MTLTFEPGVRLRSRPEFTAVQEHGRRVASRYLVLLGTPNQRGCDRLGIIASRRLGNAVMRNLAKRRLREVFRHCDSRATAPSDVRTLDLVAIPRRELVAAPFADIQSEFQHALRRLRAMRSA